MAELLRDWGSTTGGMNLILDERLVFFQRQRRMGIT
jgi:hypothetical protein